MVMPKGARPLPFVTLTATTKWDLAVQVISIATRSKCCTEDCRAVSLSVVQKESADQISARRCSVLQAACDEGARAKNLRGAHLFRWQERARLSQGGSESARLVLVQSRQRNRRA